MQIRNIDFIADLQGLPATGFIGYFGRANEDPMLKSNRLDITDGEGGAVATNPLIVGLNGGWVNNTASGTEVTPYIAETEYSLKIVSPEGGVLRHYRKIVGDGGTGGGGGGVDSDYDTLAIAQTSSILDSGFSSVYIVSELAPTGNGPVNGFYAYSDDTTGPASSGDAQKFYDVNGDGFSRNIEQRMPPRDSILAAADLTDPNAVLLALQAGENVFEYTDGFLVRWDQIDINTGAMTIDLDGLGAKSVKKIDVNGASVDLDSGDASGNCTAVYSLAADVFTLISTDSALYKYFPSTSDQIITRRAAVTVWTSEEVPQDNGWSGITWSPELGIFVSVANNSLGGTDTVMTSPDGISWTGYTPAADSTWRDVTWSADLTLFVAVGASGTDRVMTSPDGITWTARAVPEANQWDSVVWSSDLTLFVAVSYDGTNRVITSPDGTTWTSRTVTTGTWRDVEWSPTASIFVAVGSTGIISSPDGITWTARTDPVVASTDYTGVVWAEGLGVFIAVDNFGAVISSVDGITWIEQAALSPITFTDVEWSEDLAVLVGTTTDALMMSSTDGTNWSYRAASADAASWNKLAWSPSLSMFCATGGVTTRAISHSL